MKARNTLSLPVQATAIQTTESVDMQKLDVAIFEFMTDFKKRSINDIMQGMCLMGFQGRVVDKRMKTLFARKWFDRNGERGGEVKYVLKKSIKHPGKETVMVKKESQIVPSNPSDIGEQWDQVHHLLTEGQGADPTAPNDAQVGDLSPAEQLVSEGAPVKPMYAVMKTDHPRVAVWKAMQDGDAYTIQDLTVLLDHFPTHKVASAVTALVANGTLVGTKLPGSNAHAYRVQPDAPMPVLQARGQKKAAAPAATPQPETKDVPVNTLATVIHPSMAPAPTKDVKVADAPQPMLSLSLKVRDTEISLEQARAIKTELVRLGFTNNDRVTKNNLLTSKFEHVVATFTIAGMQFTLDEVVELANGLYLL